MTSLPKHENANRPLKHLIKPLLICCLTGSRRLMAASPPPYQSNTGVISVTFTNLPIPGSQFFRLHKL